MIDTLKIGLNIKRWKQHVQLQLKLMSLSVKNIIKKINAIVRLKKRHVNIKFNIFISKIYKGLESFIVSLTGYEIIDIANALASSSFMLIFVKIGFFMTFSFQIPFKFNLLLLVWFFGISISYNINFYIRYMMYKIIRKSLSDYSFGILYNTWDDVKVEFDDKEMVVKGYQDENLNIIKLPIDHWYYKVVISIFTLLIQIRLFMMSQPYLFIFGRFIVFYWLIFNKYLILTYFISLIVLVGRYVLLYQHNDMKSLNIYLSPIYNEKATIKPTKKNAFIILLAITNLIKLNSGERFNFYVLEKEPKNKLTKNYIQRSNKKNSAVFLNYPSEFKIDELIFYWKYKNYDSQVKEVIFYEKNIIKTKIKNNPFKNLWWVAVILGVLITMITFIQDSNVEEIAMMIPKFPITIVPSLQTITKSSQISHAQLSSNAMSEMYKRQKLSNIDTKHPANGFFIYEKDTKTYTFYYSHETTNRRSYKPGQILIPYKKDPNHSFTINLWKIMNITEVEKTKIETENDRKFDVFKQQELHLILDKLKIINAPMLNSFLSNSNIYSEYIRLYQLKINQPAEMPTLFHVFLNYPFQPFSISKSDFEKQNETVMSVLHELKKYLGFTAAERQIINAVEEHQKVLWKYKNEIFELAEQYKKETQNLGSIVENEEFKQVDKLKKCLLENMSIEDSFKESELEYKGLNFPAKDFSKFKGKVVAYTLHDLFEMPNKTKPKCKQNPEDE